jgi:hypothetical protein
MMTSVRYLDNGSIEERAIIVVKALAMGMGRWVLRQNREYYGIYLIDLEDGEIIVVPRNLMDYLISHDSLEFELEH